MEFETKKKTFKVKFEFDGTYTICIFDEGQWIEASLSSLYTEEVDEIINMLKYITKKE